MLSSNLACSFSGLSFIWGSVSNTSLIRFADTDALGNSIEIIEIIKNAITICIVYCKKAIMSPTCIIPSSILCPPTQIINIIIACIMNIIAGIIKLIALFTNTLFFIKFVFASSNLFSSLFCVLNALITGKPVKISLATKFNLSIKSCIFLNLGIATINNAKTTAIISITAKAITHAIERVPVLITLITPPIPIIGAYTNTLNNIVINCCICCTSFVLLVINDAVENWLNSAVEKLNTFLNNFSLKVLPSLAATLDDKNIIVTAESILINATPAICNPTIRI